MEISLAEKRRELTGILAADNDLKRALLEVNKMNIIKASLLARVNKHRNVRIETILEGDLQKDLAVGDYIFIQNFVKVVQMGYNHINMDDSFNIGLLLEAYRILAEDEDAGFRKNSPVIYSLNHVPPQASDVEARLSEVIRKLNSDMLGNNVAAKAMYLHNSIIDIWPFGEYNIELAIFAVNYFLLEKGLMPIEMPIDKREYIELMRDCLKGERLRETYSFFSRAITDKMDKTLEACRSYVR